jgi:serine/threonine-protein kinase HipA
MNGQVVGIWTLGSNGQHTFTYHEDWLVSPLRRALSLSLPLRPVSAPYRGAVVEAFFDNLLPDSREIRQRIRSRFRTGSVQAFDLLAKIGRDCVGAVQLLPEGEAPGDWQRIEGERLDVAGVAGIMRGIPTAAVYDAGDFRISLAGAQEKTALLRHAGAWYRPLGTTPTTHIFKLPLGHVGNMRLDLATSVENEWLCTQIARAYGLVVADCEMASFEEQKVLVVERFDRRLSADGKYWLRLPQEDMCQALGVPPSLKYEADGGPGIRAILDLLLGSTRADADRLAFFKTQVMFWLLPRISAWPSSPGAVTGSPRCMTCSRPGLFWGMAPTGWRQRRQEWQWPCCPATVITSGRTSNRGIGCPPRGSAASTRTRPERSSAIWSKPRPRSWRQRTRRYRADFRRA